MTENFIARLQKSSAFILCGGLGTRLRAVVADRPKSMALVAGVPFLELLVRQLRGQGVRQIVLGTGYLAEAIEEHFGDGRKFGVEICYSREEHSLGTAGALKNAQAQLGDPILVLNGDSYAEWDARKLSKMIHTRQADLIMVLQRVSDISRYGSVTMAPDGRLLRFVEKGSLSGEGLINAGIYLLRRDLLKKIPVGSSSSLERDIFPSLLNGNSYGYISAGLFIDIGIPADLERAQAVLAPQANAGSSAPHRGDL